MSDALTRHMLMALIGAGVNDRPTAENLPIVARDAILNVAAWSGIEEDAWLATLDLLDPWPVGSKCYIIDHDGDLIRHEPIEPVHQTNRDLIAVFGTDRPAIEFTVVRSYWPAAACEVVADHPRFSHMTRNHHDRLTLERTPA